MFSLKVTDAAGLYHEDTVSMTVVAAANALTAAFENARSSHDGSTGFTVGLRFSEEVSLSYTAFTRGLPTVAGGTVVSARRLAPPSDVGWEVSVSPSRNDDVVATLPADRACGVQRTVCTSDDRRLSQAASVTVAGPAAEASPEITGSSSFTVAEGETSVATLTATDVDTNASDLAWSIPSGAAGGSDAGRFTLTSAGGLSFASAKDFEAPDDADGDGTYRVSVKVSDGGRDDPAELAVALANRNEAPTADAGADQAGMAEGAAVTLAGSGRDPDAGDTLSYAWTQTDGTSVTLSGSATVTATFNAPGSLTEDVTLTFRMKVTDAEGLYDEDRVSVMVEREALLSDDATLSSLVLSEIDIGSFDGATESYAANVENLVSSTQVTATPTHARASVSIAHGGGSSDGNTRRVRLSQGANTITVTVTAGGQCRHEALHGHGDALGIGCGEGRAAAVARHRAADARQPHGVVVGRRDDVGGYGLDHRGGVAIRARGWPSAGGRRVHLDGRWRVPLWLVVGRGDAVGCRFQWRGARLPAVGRYAFGREGY